MIAPDFRICSPVDLRTGCKSYVETNHGTELWQNLEPQIVEVMSIKEQLRQAPAYKSDVEQLHKFKELFCKNYNNSMLLNKYFTFGTSSMQIPVKFIWNDSFNGAQVKSYSPVFDALGSKYNVGVCLARISCYMDLTGDGIKKACKYMQQAAWIFEDLKKDVATLKPGETSADFTAESLTCLSALMLAQSQYLFYKLATEQKLSPELLSKVALQISKYFKEAHEASQMNMDIKKFQNGSWANILLYHGKYFEASAWQVLGVHRFAKAKEEGEKMGEAAGTAHRAMEIYKSCEPIMQQIPPNYNTNFQNKLKQTQQLAQMSEDKAKNVFFEPIMPAAKVPMPDCKNFVKFDESIKMEFAQTPVMNETLRHVIPPQVRSMQKEFHGIIQNLIDQHYKNQDKLDQEEKVFLGQFKLPMAYHELTASEAIPESYATKISDFQKKGAISNFQSALENIGSFRTNCEQMLQETEAILAEEETFDKNMRDAYKEQWVVLASPGLNQPYRQNIEMYRQKIGMAKSQDENTQKRYQDQKGELDILCKSTQELEAMMPSSDQGQQIAEMPVSKAIKQALDNIDGAKTKKSELLSEAVTNLANLNMVEHLMAVHTQKTTKEAVFSEQKEEFNKIWVRIGEQEDLVKASNQVIKENAPKFEQLKATVSVDPARQAFFQRIDFALMCQTDLENMLHQGSEFYERLIEHLTILKQNVKDFKVSRFMQMETECQKLGVAPPQNDTDGAYVPPAGTQNVDSGNFNFEFFQPPG